MSETTVTQAAASDAIALPEPSVLLSIEGGIAVITLNRPSAHNAIDMSLAEGFAEAIAAVAQRDDAEVIVLTGTGKAFSTGGDVLAMSEAADRALFLATLATTMHDALATLATLPKVTIVAVNGIVAGAGLGIMLAGDLVVASEKATFSSAYAGLGLTPDCGVTANLPRSIGLHRALELTVGGRRIAAAEARTWGLVSEVVPTGTCLDRAMELARLTLGRAPAALGQTRVMLRASMEQDFRSSLAAEVATLVTRSESSESQTLIGRFTAARK